MSTLVFTIKSTDTQANLQQKFQLNSNQKLKFKNDAANYLKSAELLHQCDIDVQTGSANPVAASATFTLVSAVATDAVTIGTVTLTASSTPANENEWEIDGATDADDATSLANAINAHSVLSNQVSASAASNVVTVTCLVKGVIGNAINFSSADATITASGTHLASGTGGATDSATSYDFGG